MTKGEIWLSIVGLAVGLPFAVGLGVFSFITATTPTLHPNPLDVPSVIQMALSPKWTGAVDRGRQLVRSTLVDDNLPGVSVAVGVDGAIVWAEGFGWADVGKRVPVTPGSRFRIGHASKPLTSAAVGVLLEKGRLHLDDEIQKYVPSFPRKQWPVTLRQLMGHVAGIRHYRGEADYTSITDHCERASEGLRRFADDPLLFEPETQYKYSTYGWVLVSAAVEAASGEPFSAFMRAKIFEPLGMGDTTTDSVDEEGSKRVTFYHSQFREVVAPVDYSCFAGGGAFLSTPSDLVRFGMALDRGKLLQRDTLKMLRRPQLLASGQETDYGLGWMLYSGPSAGEPIRATGHVSLTLRGGSASFMIFPEGGVVVAVMTNISSMHTREMAEPIAQAFAKADDNRER